MKKDKGTEINDDCDQNEEKSHLNSEISSTEIASATIALGSLVVAGVGVVASSVPVLGAAGVGIVGVLAHKAVQRKKEMEAQEIIQVTESPTD